MLVPSQPANVKVTTSIINKRWLQVDLPMPWSWPLLINVYVNISQWINNTVNKGRAWKTPSCSCQLCIKLEVCYGDCWKLWRLLEAATGCRRGPQYDEKCSFYFNCYFFCTPPTNQDLRQKAVYFTSRIDARMLQDVWRFKFWLWLENLHLRLVFISFIMIYKHIQVNGYK